MIQFASYIDRQKAGPGSSEKSQKVHSANWKEEIQLRKELDCLNKQEEQRVSRISSDQRIVVHRFQRKLSQSAEVASKHDKVRWSLNSNRGNTSDAEGSSKCWNNDELPLRPVRCLSSNPKPPLPKFRRAKSCEPKSWVNQPRSDEQSAPENAGLPQRPVTALERNKKLWERQLKTVTQRLNRARSAPARTSCFRVPEFTASRCSENSTVAAARSSNGCPKQRRARAGDVEIDLEHFRRLREREVLYQRQAVETFLKAIEPLVLVPWTAGLGTKQRNDDVKRSMSAEDENGNETRPQSRSMTDVNNSTKNYLVLKNKELRKTVQEKSPINAWN